MVENLSLYRIFYKVAKAGSISEAARELYLTQPAVSAQIRALEDELHTRLFFRTGRGVILTPQGEMLIGYIERAFALLESGEDKLRDIAGLRDGILRIGASDMTLRFYLLDHLQKFHAIYPGVRLHVTNAPTPDTLGALRAGQIDFGVISGESSAAHIAIDADDDIRMVPVRMVQDVFIERASEASEDAGVPVTAEELLARPLILLESHTSTRRYIDAWFSANCGGKTPTAAIELATSDLILAFAQRGIGVGCIAEDFAHDAIRSGVVRRIALAEELPARPFFLVTLKHLSLSAAARAFLAQLGVRDR